MTSIFADRRLRASYGWAAGGVFASQGLLWLVSLWVARHLEASDYGLLAMATIFTSFCVYFQDAGLGSAIIQKRELDRRDAVTAFTFTVVVGVTVTAVLWLIAPLVAQLYHEPRVTAVLRALALTLVLVALRAVPFALLTKQLAFASRTKAEVVSAFVGSAAAVALAWNGCGVWSLVGGSLVTQTLLTGLVYVYSAWRPALAWHPTVLRALLRFGVPATAAGFLWQIYIQSDQFLIGALLGPQALGLYVMAWTLAGTTQERIVAVLNRVSYSAFSSMQSDRRAVAAHWVDLNELIAWTTFPLLVGLALVADTFVAAVLTDKWAGIVPVLRILCLLALMRNFGTLTPHLIIALGHPGKNLLFDAINTVALPAILAVGALTGGVVGVAIAWVVAYPLLFVWRFRLALRLTASTIGAHLHRLRAPGLATAAMAVVVWFIGHLGGVAPMARLICQVGGGGAVYALCVLIWLQKTGRLSMFCSAATEGAPAADTRMVWRRS